MVMATTFLGWKGTVSSHVHRFHWANVYLYTEIWRDAHGMCLQWVCGCIWNVYSFKCIVGFSLCVFYARNVTSVCFFSCQWVGWTVVLPSACLHVRVCVCKCVCVYCFWMCPICGRCSKPLHTSSPCCWCLPVSLSKIRFPNTFVMEVFTPYTPELTICCGTLNAVFVASC